jgi:hypothetical protein
MGFNGISFNSIPWSFKWISHSSHFDILEGQTPQNLHNVNFGFSRLSPSATKPFPQFPGLAEFGEDMEFDSSGQYPSGYILFIVIHLAVCENLSQF